jgi:hypothetical protein
MPASGKKTAPSRLPSLAWPRGTRVTVEGVWSKRTRTTKDGQLRINDVLTVHKIRLFTETEISAPDVDDDIADDDELMPVGAPPEQQPA